MTINLKKVSLMLITFLSAGAVFAGHTYKIDTGHSAVQFTVSHMNVSSAQGRFNEFDGSFTYDAAKPEASELQVTIQAGSIDTNHAKRDKHLRSPDFFNANQFATVSFKSNKVTKSSSGLKITGDLTLMGVTKTVTFELSEVREGESPRGDKLLGFDGVAKIKRSTFGMNAYVKEGAIGDDVEIRVSIEAAG